MNPTKYLDIICPNCKEHKLIACFQDSEINSETLGNWLIECSVCDYQDSNNYILDEIEYENKFHINRIINQISLFKNGEELFRNSALFNKIVRTLAQGKSTYDIIEMLIEMQSKTEEAFKEYLNNSVPLSRLINK